jgi:myo-inositol-1(or 4)-monophosphatase
LPVNELEVAIQAAIKASEIILENYGSYKQLDYKSDIDVVTEVDHKCEEEITKILKELTPDYGIMAEEGTSFPGEKVWVVDPLDGTINFAHSFPIFGPSIGLCKGNEPLVGVITDPLRKELFYAVKGSGAYVNDLYNKGTPRRIHVSDVKELKKSIIACGLPYERQGEYYQKLGDKLVNLEREIQSVRKLGAAALSMAYIASGRLEGYIVSGAHPWDMAGGLIILEEAGGKITNYQGEPYTLDTKEWMATNGHLHDMLVSMYK